MDFARTTAKVFVSAKEPFVAEADMDTALVARVQTGEVAAFDELVRKYRARLYSVMYNLTGNREDAGDLTQDAFIKAFQSINRFRGKSAFYTWLYRIAVNHAMTFLKKSRRRRFFSFENMSEEAGANEIFEAIASKTRTEKRILMEELQERLNESLQKLSEKHRTVVVLHEIEGLGHSEIAEITGSSIGTVRSRLHYAKNQLQADLQTYIG
jgi:RNA polymerase sigma-70 factor (ECF subfamily)